MDTYNEVKNYVTMRMAIRNISATLSPAMAHMTGLYNCRTMG